MVTYSGNKAWQSRLACILAAALAMAAVPALAAPGDMPPRVDPASPNVQPPYPDGAQVNGEEGDIALSVEVSSRGKVRNVRVTRSSGFVDLDNAAIGGVMGWHFLPAIKDGDTATEWTTVNIVYRLPRPAARAAPAQPSTP